MAHILDSGHSIRPIERLDIKDRQTFAPAAAALETSLTHCSRLCAMEAVEHICPTACFRLTSLLDNGKENGGILTAIAMAKESALLKSTYGISNIEA